MSLSIMRYRDNTVLRIQTLGVYLSNTTIFEGMDFKSITKLYIMSILRVL